ncbi:hypothetical protein [Kordiimonas laminariae]|uniref:hypothetical protein n=1 Tax=Kordiimonas laminariae TaxID=2917717 RepID=UPI001FF26119|nr:hypothetical protein [Kordiimonas laminariae]MCK0070786.1 hypothetical protein [Kordiimonas laminariae]
MQMLAKLLVVVAFLAGAYLTSLHPTEVDWTAFGPIVIAGALGVIMSKRLEAAAAKDDSVLASNRQDLEDSLKNIVKNLSDLEGRKDKVPTYDMRFEIDKLFREDLIRFADARETMKHLYGVQAYADVMSSFAAGERYINRVWSASTDGYVDEVLTYVSKSLSQFKHAQEEFNKAVSSAR